MNLRSPTVTRWLSVVAAGYTGLSAYYASLDPTVIAALPMRARIAYGVIGMVFVVAVPIMHKLEALPPPAE